MIYYGPVEKRDLSTLAQVLPNFSVRVHYCNLNLLQIWI